MEIEQNKRWQMGLEMTPGTRFLQVLKGFGFYPKYNANLLKDFQKIIWFM